MLSPIAEILKKNNKKKNNQQQQSYIKMVICCCFGETRLTTMHRSQCDAVVLNLFVKENLKDVRSDQVFFFFFFIPTKLALKEK